MRDDDNPPTAESLRAAVCGWLEADGWSVSIHRGGRRDEAAESRHFCWLALAYKDSSPLVIAEPAAGRERLILSRHFTLGPAEVALLEALPDDEQSDLAWELLRDLNLLLVDYEVDRPVPREVLLTVTIVRDGLDRDRLQRDVLRLTAAFRLVCLTFERALGSLLEEPAEPVVH
jgi:hypothetical protein